MSLQSARQWRAAKSIVAVLVFVGCRPVAVHNGQIAVK
jgi:hypothetical protein